MNPEIKWTKNELVQSVNSRVDQGKFGKGAQFIMSGDISDDALEAWQEAYDANRFNPMVLEDLYTHLYQSIIAGF